MMKRTFDMLNRLFALTILYEFLFSSLSNSQLHAIGCTDAGTRTSIQHDKQLNELTLSYHNGTNRRLTDVHGHVIREVLV